MTLTEVLGDPPARAALLVRLFREVAITTRVDAVNQCWPARRPLHPDGTVHVTVGTTEVCLARLVFACVYGEQPPPGYAVTTTCRRPECINPHHVVAVPKASLFRRRRAREVAA